MNRPRNLVLQFADPREPVVCEFGDRDISSTDGVNTSEVTTTKTKRKLVIHQTPADASWPGGALWDCGVLLAELILAVSGHEDMKLTCTLDVEALPHQHQQQPNNMMVQRMTTQLSSRVDSWLKQRGNHKLWQQKVESVVLNRPNLKIVELGCGVGMTGLVAALALPQVAACILTDLTVVVQDVTFKNVHENIPPTSSNAKIVGMPLCWGNTKEGEQVLQKLQELTTNTTTSSSDSDNNKNNNSDSNKNDNDNVSYPDVILLGDVAYQHRPDEPWPFDDLVKTIQELMPPNRDYNDDDSPPKTLLIFGIRLRQAASIELLHMLEKRFTSVLTEPIPAEILDPGVTEYKHNMTIHIFTNQ